MIEVYLHLGRPEFLKLNVNIVGDFSDYTSRGYLDDYLFGKRKGSFRVLSLGDSFARNLTWENKNYHNYLDQILLNHPYKNIEIINAGMEGTGPGYYWHILKKYGDAIKPDLVLVGFFVGNDFEEMEFRYTFSGFYGMKDRVNLLDRFFSYCRFKNWWTYQFASRKLTLLSERYKNQPQPAQEGGELASFSQDAFFGVERARMWIFEKSRQPYLKRNFTRLAGVIRNFKTWCAQRNVGLLLAIFPDQIQVEEPLRRKLLAYFHIDASALDISYPNKLLSDYCKSHDINWVDLLPGFQQASRSQKLYRLQDTHWNDAGNRLAARVIVDGLQKYQLIQQDHDLH